MIINDMMRFWPADKEHAAPKEVIPTERGYIGGDHVIMRKHKIGAFY